MSKVNGLLVLLLCTACSLQAVAQTTQNRNNSAFLALMKTSVDDLQHEVGNHEEELKMLEERLNSQESLLDALRHQLLEDQEQSRQTTASQTRDVEKRAATVENSLSGVVSDIRQLQDHANETAETLKQYKNKIEGLEKQIVGLRSAVDGLLDALQLNTASQVYEVRPGDSLEKIARRNQTTIKKLKEINDLKNDRIYTGQRLKLL